MHGDYVTTQDIGLCRVKISVSYDDPLGKVHSFSDYFYLSITEPREEERDSAEDTGSQDQDSDSTDVDNTVGEGELKPIVKVIEQFDEQEERDDRPLPHIVRLSSTGLLTIAWSKPMKPYEKPTEIVDT